MNTIAVGPFDPVAFCVTGGLFASTARPLLCRHWVEVLHEHRAISSGEARVESLDKR